jgi:predicted RNA-binding Zn-ribbon protein involved in translation (DUF1610 family)
MNSKFTCPSCQKAITVTEDLVGTKIGCPFCGQRVDVHSETSPSTASRSSSIGRSESNLLPSEHSAILSFAAQMAGRPAGKNRYHINIELEEDARKHAITFLGILPLLEASSAKNILHVSCDDNAAAGAQNNVRELMVLSQRLEFTTLEDLSPAFDYGQAKKILSGRWVICDLDLSRVPGPTVDQESLARQNEKRNRTLNKILFSEDCDRVLLHQKGRPCFLKEFPPVLKTGCFVATAACGSSTAWEVDVLRGFRDGVLMESSVGRFAAAAYYRLSPPLARLIDRRPLLQKTVRFFLITPLARLIRRERLYRHGS